ncbi:putative F420-dependent oxidoreductase, Rv3093c family [Nocardia amikacinitolerans]|uniref:LLM class F420-dependent oxidoreductase n=1 Tax=Nocardia amikacinitolerans TaxID=756689 RepID=UPI00082FC21D|nr:LLM class F420-dependent oxidoreductase [Nocardia amikacinitolerans]MCP2317673.1 putative F420-dependent oxidoreductase, Rv3093c family [Nocardia amikacinitolerans]
MSRLGLTIPLDTAPLARQREQLDDIEASGFTDLWSAEASGADAFTPLVAAAVSHPSFRFGTAIVPAYTRGPALMAMSAAALADVSQSEVVLGIGTSSDVIVEKWNGLRFHAPYQRVRDVATFLRRTLTGEKVDMVCESFSINGFRLDRVPQRQPKIMIAALRPGMLRLAGTVADGAIINWLSPTDVHQVTPHVLEANPQADIVARLFVVPSRDLAAVRATARRAIAAYLNVPVYAEFHRWLGRGEQLEPMWRAWQAGDRAAALAAIPDELIDELFLHGTPAEISARIKDYVDAGVTTPVLAIMPAAGEPPSSIASIAAIGRAYIGDR